MDFTQYDDTLLDNPLTPKFYEDGLREEGIIGNDEAVKAVATLFYKTGEGLPGTMLIAGPTGSGKTELFRALRRFTHEDLIKIVDATAITPAGFKGDFKITNLIKDLASPGILVLDEADKMLEPHTGAEGTNYTDMLQNALLKITDGDDKVLISKDDGSGAMAYVDTSRISVVFVGAFQRLLEKKSLESGGIGFGNTPRHKCDYTNTTITQEDLIEYGSCYDDVIFTCDCCGRQFHQDDGFFANDISLCSHCYDSYYTHCAHCDALIGRSEAYYYDGNPYCHDCLPDFSEFGSIGIQKTIGAGLRRIF